MLRGCCGLLAQLQVSEAPVLNLCRNCTRDSGTGILEQGRYLRVQVFQTGNFLSSLLVGLEDHRSLSPGNQGLVALCYLKESKGSIPVASLTFLLWCPSRLLLPWF